MFIRTFCLISFAVVLTGCKIDNLSGYAQKGPFDEGATVYLYSLDFDGDRERYGDDDKHVSNSSGKFKFKDVASGWIELSVTGRYFNEYTNALSDHSITLDAVTDKGLFGEKANINLFTHLAAARIFDRVRDDKTLHSAWRDAQSDLKEVFGLSRISRSDDRGVEKLNLVTGDGEYNEDNANLLLFTGGFLAVGGDAAKLLLLTDDFADDGRFNGVGLETFNSIAEAASEEGLLEKLSE